MVASRPKVFDQMAAPFPEIMKLSATLSDGKLDYKD
jgi:hypothetical protein